MRRNLFYLLLLFACTQLQAQPLSREDKSKFDYANNQFTGANYADAIRYCSQIIEGGVRNIEVYELRAKAYRITGDYEKAAADYSQVIRNRGNYPQYYLDRAKMYTCEKDFDDAQQDLNEAIRLMEDNNPLLAKHDYLMHEQRGRIYHYLGDYRDAIKDFKTAIENGSVMAHLDLLTSLFRNKDFADLRYYSDSLLSYTRNSTNTPLLDDALNNYVNALNEISNKEPSASALKKIDLAISAYKNPDTYCFPGFYYDLLSLKAYILTYLGQDSTAFDIYKKVYASNSHQQDVKSEIDRLKVKLNIDAIPPTITLINPQLDDHNTANMSSQKGVVELYGKVFDSSGIGTVFVNGKQINKIEYDGLFVMNVELQAGRNEITIAATDKYDNKGEKSFTINLVTGEEKKDENSDIPELTNKTAYHAILIAENDYQDKNIGVLNNPVKDAKELKDILVNNYMFDEKNVMVLTNANRSMLDSITKKCQSLSDDDNLLVFYAGHGTVRKLGSQIQDGYLIPVDAKKGSWSSYVSSNELKSSMEGCNAKHILFVVDACFGGALFRSLDNAPPDIRRQYQSKSRKMLTSGNLEEVPDNGSFMEALKGFLLKNDLKYVSATDLYTYVQKFVDGTTPLYERILDLGDAGGNFIFIHR